MKKSLLALFLAAVLAFACVMPAAVAESAGSKVQSILNQVQNFLTEETGAGKEIAKELAEKVVTFVRSMPEKGKSIRQYALQLVGRLTSGAEKLDSDTVSGLISMLLGSGSVSDASLTDFGDSQEVQEYQAWRQSIEDFLTAYYSEGQEPADVLIPHTYPVRNDADEFPENCLLGSFGLEAFTAEGTDLKMAYAASDVLLLALEPDGETGAVKVTDVRRAEDGEKYADSVAEMCAQYGVSPERFVDDISIRDWLDLFDLTLYLDEHPEYQRIEVQGELRTKEEIEAFADEVLSQMLASEE